MDNFEKHIELYKESFTEAMNRSDYDLHLLTAIAKYLGPSIYNKDSARVACSKTEERTAVKKAFLIKKLKLKDSPDLDNAIKEVCQTMGSSNRNKWRPIFYYLLVEKFDKQEVFLVAKKENVASPKEDKKKVPVTDSKAKTTQDNTPPSVEEPIYLSSEGSENIINTHAIYAAGAGLIPIPLVDMVSVSTVQYKMIKKLAAQYDHVTFDDKKAKSTIAAIMGGVGAFELGLFTRIFFKRVPIIGPVIGGTAMSAFSYVSTKVVGEIFDEHFATGGDLSIEALSLKKMKETFNLSIRKKE